LWGKQRRFRVEHEYSIKRWNHGADFRQKTTLDFWAAAITPEREAFWQGVVKDFNDKNPDITVNYLGVPGDLSAYIEKLNVAIAAGQAPDIINNFTSDMISRGVLEPLDGYFDKGDGKGKITPGSLTSAYGRGRRRRAHAAGDREGARHLAQLRFADREKGADEAVP
jgi:maltose-binding protein MalE